MYNENITLRAKQSDVRNNDKGLGVVREKKKGAWDRR